VNLRFLIFQVKIGKSILIYWSCYYFVTFIIAAKKSLIAAYCVTYCVLDNLRVLLGGIFVSSVPRIRYRHSPMTSNVFYGARRVTQSSHCRTRGRSYRI